MVQYFSLPTNQPYKSAPTALQAAKQSRWQLVQWTVVWSPGGKKNRARGWSNS